ncbi:coronin-2B-like isoform X2 [Ctenocephalides felis]|uniref:coronin-2B-like isoform X2 n=1 Tax=Ctenocephalides felis TaxID=7515 RepID=UPI000E6E215B|nr:coronin-2B-like isoform X2 [Ctenocephalides felis]
MTNTQLWFRGVRSSRFRHVYGAPARRERCYDGVPVTRNAHDAHFCAVNGKFVAIVTEVAGGGAFLVLPIEQTGRIDFHASRVTGHTGPVLDIKWNPFDDNVIASCSDDCTVKLWHIPDGGLGGDLRDWIAELRGHKRRVGYVEWHPTARNVLFSAGFDHLIIVWDVSNAEAINVIDCHPDVIYCMSLNRDGSLLATTCKDKKLRVIEPRSGLVLSEGFCHTGTKASKTTFLSNGRVLTTGFSRHSDRQWSVWDQHDLSAPLATEVIDSSSGIVFPYYDYDTNMIYLAGKGDGNIRYYEVVDNAPHMHYLSQFLSGNPQRGLGFMPKRGLDTSQCEVFRFYKLHATRGICEPISMIVPRKSAHFQADLYPDTASDKPALTAEEWASGRNAQPLLVSMKTGENIDIITTTGTNRAPKKLLVQQNGHNGVSENNKKKFAFLSCETVPDYRPMDTNDTTLTEKNQKTSSNQSTKFHQLQQMFGNGANNNVVNSIISNELNRESPNNSPARIITNSDIFHSENELRKAYNKQSEELRQTKKQLAFYERKVRELESIIRNFKEN